MTSCHANRCRAPVPRPLEGQFFCERHWWLMPGQLRQRLGDAYGTPYLPFVLKQVVEKLWLYESRCIHRQGAEAWA